MSSSSPDKPSSLALRRIVAMLSTGAVAGVAVGVVDSWWYAGVVGWIGACIVYISWVWRHLWPLDSDHLRTHATREDPGIVLSDLLVLGASVASLIAVALILVRAGHEAEPERAITAAIALVSVALSWFLIHTLYAQRYAREYYAHPEGGIDFEADGDEDGDDDPVFSDFAYLSFDLGMTYQVSDTTLHSQKLRRIVLRHTLLSYLFGTVILASTINLIAGLGS